MFKELFGIGLAGHMYTWIHEYNKTHRYFDSEHILCKVNGNRSLGYYKVEAFSYCPRATHIDIGNPYKQFYFSKGFRSYEEALAHLVGEVRDAQKRYKNTRFFRKRMIEPIGKTYTQELNTEEYIAGEWHDSEYDFYSRTYDCLF